MHRVSPLSLLKLSVKVKEVDLYSAICEYHTFNVLMYGSHSHT